MSQTAEPGNPQAETRTQRPAAADGASSQRPPPLPEPGRRPPENPPDSDYAPMRGILGLGPVMDAVLRTPGHLAYEIAEGRRGPVVRRLLQVTAGFLLLSGFAMGTFAGESQLWKIPLKVTVGTLFSAIICLPSLHIFASLSGARQTFAQTAAILLTSICLCSLLLAGFAPIGWVFAQATSTTVFMGLLHMAFWAVGIGFGVSLLGRNLRLVNRAAVRGIGLWAVVFGAVLLQMSTTLRPLIGRDDGPLLKPKKFVVQHWVSCLEGPKP